MPSYAEIGGYAMKPFTAGDRVQLAKNAVEMRSTFTVSVPRIDFLGSTVTILDRPYPEQDLYRIKEDGGKYLYAGNCFTRQAVHRWSEKEIAAAQRLICKLLIQPGPKDKAGDSYFFIDLVTPSLTKELASGRPRVLLAKTTLLSEDIKLFTGTANELDEPNLYIGMAVCLCKAKGVPIPNWIAHPDENGGGVCH